MESPEGQLALIKVWAHGTDFAVDDTNTPKANFAALAKAQGWEGGDVNWRMHWEACFKEAYVYGQREDSTSPTTPQAALDLVEQSRRRLSSSSDVSAVSTGSEFSLISAVPSIQSLDTNGSILGGVVLELESLKLEDSEDVSSPTPMPTSKHAVTSARLHILAKSTDSAPQSSTPGDAQSILTSSPFWSDFPGFEPDPRAPFKHELGRLCKHVGAKTKNEKKNLQKLALTAEIKFHYGASMGRLDRWQELCREVGIEKIPTSITQCQKVLKPVFVNLFNLVDHRRNPDLQVLRFKSYGEFNKFTRKGNEFPRDCAKQEGFIKVLLKKM
ncbi:hypothetical protein E8E13_009464 [Curvularia kusanoi]|uniref:Uncharacterized protein n=1 Tax=Curvularia kusanoi TaxID=90978 RepID=A0A9P4WBX4_CURKU|nr:hypothetical protein E8E13_009464 [Curvularia kusanoi]